MEKGREEIVLGHPLIAERIENGWLITHKGKGWYAANIDGVMILVKNRLLFSD